MLRESLVHVSSIDTSGPCYEGEGARGKKMHMIMEVRGKIVMKITKVSYLTSGFLLQRVRHDHLNVIVDRLTIRALPPRIRGGTLKKTDRVGAVPEKSSILTRTIAHD